MSINRCNLPYDYYWRDYTGIIPNDAVEGGIDNKGKIYIGQALVQNYGIIPVAIHPGETTVAAAIYGVRHVSIYIKILCSSSKEKFSWMNTTSEHFHLDTIGKHVVRGGLEGGIINNIGRISYRGQTVISKVHPLAPGDTKFLYPDGNKEQWAPSYQVLIYDID